MHCSRSPSRKVRCARDAAFGGILVDGIGQIFGESCKISSRDIPVCWDRVCSTSAPIVCSNCAGAICLFGPRATHESATSPCPFCLKASISSRSPPLNVSPMLAPPSIPPRFPGVASRAPAFVGAAGSAGLLCAPRSISAILSLFWYPAMARSPSRAVIEGYPRLISSSLLLDASKLLLRTISVECGLASRTTRSNASRSRHRCAGRRSGGD